jgi:hypothetical protein
MRVRASDVVAVPSGPGLAVAVDAGGGFTFEHRLALNRRRRRVVLVRLALTILTWAAVAALLVVLPALVVGAMV